MTKKNLVLCAAAFVLAVVYVVYFTDWLKPKTIQIFHTSRSARFKRTLRAGISATDPQTEPMTFGFNQKYQLTEIKVVSLAALQTNQNALPIWHLISDSNSMPIKFFFYGERIRGMKPEVAGSRPEPLQPGVKYRLFVAAGSIKGQHDFQPVADAHSQ